MDGLHNKSALLINCSRNSLALAEINTIQPIAFHCISAGVYGFPPKLVAEIAIQTALAYLSEQQSNLRLTFCSFLESDLEIYQGLLGRV